MKPKFVVAKLLHYIIKFFPSKLKEFKNLRIKGTDINLIKSWVLYFLNKLRKFCWFYHHKKSIIIQKIHALKDACGSNLEMFYWLVENKELGKWHEKKNTEKLKTKCSLNNFALDQKKEKTT